MSDNKINLGDIKITSKPEATLGKMPIQTISSDQAAQQQTEQKPAEQQEVEHPSSENQAPPESTSPSPEQSEHEWVAALRSRGVESIDNVLNRLDKYEELEKKASSVPELDDYGKRLIDAYVKGDDLRPFLEAASLDPSTLTDEQVIQRQLQSEYPNASGEEMAYLMRMKKKEFGFSPDASEEEQEEAAMAMKVAANMARRKIAEQLEQYKAPAERDPKTQYEYYMKQLQPYWEQQAKEMQQREQDALTSSPAWQHIAKEKALKITYEDGKGGKHDFNYRIDDPNKLAPYLLNLNNIAQAFVTEDGNVDYDRALRLAAYVNDPVGFERQLMQFGKTLGNDQVINEVSNATQETRTLSPGDGKPQGPQEEVKSFLGAAFASKGKK